MSNRSKPAGFCPGYWHWYATAMMSPTTSSELERMYGCGSSVCVTIFG
jgi:hypothetical protein